MAHIDRLEGASMKSRGEIGHRLTARRVARVTRQIAARASRSGTYAEHSLHLRAPASLLPPGSGCIGIVDGPRRAITRIIGFLEAVKALLLPLCTRARSLLRSLSFLSVVLPKNSIGLSACTRVRTTVFGPARMATGRAAIAFR